MKSILIVDDNENNRMLLRAFFDIHLKDHIDAKLSIDEAVNGVEAVALAQEKHYDLIMMDIMMPEMDGIEATKLINIHDPKTMIIAVSAVEDRIRQKEILENGAEDYISKPINIDILSHRMNHYFSLIDSRKQKTYSHPNGHNLFTQSVYCRELHFFIQNDHDLAEFWEYYLHNPEIKAISEAITDVIRTFYVIGAMALKNGIKPLFIIEESEKYLYFTMESIASLDSKIIPLALAKLNNRVEFEFNHEKLSIKLPLNRDTDDLEVSSQSPIDSNVINTLSGSVSETLTEEMAPAKQEVVVYDYMDEDDLDHIRDYLNRLNTLLLMVGSGDIHNEEVQEIAEYLNRVARVTSTYSECYSIGRALNVLSETIREHSQEFIDKSVSLGTLCAAFSRDLISWMRLIFEEGATSVNFMDDTIITNAQMIGSMLSVNESADDSMNLDDIFDF